MYEQGISIQDALPRIRGYAYVHDFDMLEFLNSLVERCVELLDVTAAGVVLSDQKGGLAMAAASSEQARLVELFSVHAERTGLLMNQAFEVMRDYARSRSPWLSDVAAQIIEGRVRRRGAAERPAHQAEPALDMTDIEPSAGTRRWSPVWE